MGSTNYQYIIDQMPYGKNFLFIDTIISVDDNHISSSYRLPKNSCFYEGHFKNETVVPGILLLEIMGQTGLVAQAIYLCRNQTQIVKPLISSIEADFHNICLPDTNLIVQSEVIYFRHSILKSKIKLLDAEKTKLFASMTAILHINYHE